MEKIMEEISGKIKLPELFLERQREMLGAEYDAFLQSYEQDNYQALRVNLLKAKAHMEEEAAKQDEKRQDKCPISTYFNMTPVSWEKNGFYYAAEAQPGKHPLHEAGVYYIQEPSAMAVVPLLGVEPGEKILDLCAAPGGKSTQIAGYLQGKGLLVSNEIHPARAKILSENIERLGVKNACVMNENPTNMSEKFQKYFDRILVDAPCSGEGMFRKNEAACEEWSPENVALCADRQDEILDCAAKMLRDGGRIVYSTCTFAPEENEGTVSRFLKRHPEFTLLPIDKAAMGIPQGRCDGRPEWTRNVEEAVDYVDYGLSGTLRLWPHVVKGEGHFAAILQNNMTSPAYEALAQGGLEKGIPPRDRSLEPWWEFWRETAKEADCDCGMEEITVAGQPLSHSIFLRFGENLYLAPDNIPSLKGLKVLRPGLQLGTLKKNRFEPSHALALALSPNDVRHRCHLCTDKEEQMRLISGYLGGQTFPMEGEKGWYLVTVDGYSIGWGKLAGGIMKNHYPKGLRKS